MKASLRKLTLVVVLLALPFQISAQEPQTLPSSALEPRQVCTIQLQGKPFEMGRQYAKAAAGDIKYLDQHFIQRFLPQSNVERLAGLVVANNFRLQMRPEHCAELDALADAASLNRGQLMLAQCFLDIMPVQACSSIALSANASPDHVARFGRNLDFPGLDELDKHSALIVYRPSGKFAFVCVSWPGLIGVLSGMNEHGLCLANMEVTRPQKLAVTGMPYTLLYRTLLENCRTVDEAIAMLETTPRQTANNLMLMDAAGDRAVAEITSAGVVVRRADALHALICTNHQRGQDADTPGRCVRYDTLHVLSAQTFGHIDVPGIESMLGSAAQGDFTLQSMIFEPDTRVIYLATGKDAAHQTFDRIELKPLLNPSER